MSGPEPPPYPPEQPPNQPPYQGGQYPSYPQGGEGGYPQGGYPQGYPQYQQPVPTGNDRTTLWGVLGIVIGLLCCGPAGIVFGILSINEASKWNKPKTLGILAIVLSALNIVAGISIAVARR